MSMQVILSREYSIPEGSILLLNNLDGENKTPLIGGGIFYKDVHSWKDGNLDIHYAISDYSEGTDATGGFYITKEALQMACNSLIGSDTVLEEEEFKIVLKLQKIALEEDNLSTGFFIYNYSS